jgi:hypothetical protein
MTSETTISALTTEQMIGYAKTWLATQDKSIPRDILQQLHDMAVSLLGAVNPPMPPVMTGEFTVTTPQLLELANKWLDAHSALLPYDFLVQIRDGTLAILQQLPKWKCSMFFQGSDGKVDSSLNFANIDNTESNEHRRYTCNAIRRNGGDTLLFIAEKLYNNPALQAEVDEALKYGVQVGLKHLIIDIKNDNNNFPWASIEPFIKWLAEHYAPFNSDQVAFMTCLETNEILDVAHTQQMVRWCKQYAPLKRVIVGSQSMDFLKQIGPGAELWLEIHTNPFNLSQSDADRYIADLQSLLPYGPVWAGEFWDGSSELSKYISRRALEIGCAGVGSNVG